ncbi:MAG: SMC-Scp complex subunit ScpB [Minisyncoccia bacterium]
MLSINAQKLHTLLFIENEPQTASDLVGSIGVSENEFVEIVEELKSFLSGSGVVLVNAGNTYMLGTDPQMAEFIVKEQKHSDQKELSKAALETLAIILYKQHASRPDIDFIRGVQSSFILRTLAMRGLIEKKTNPADSRSFIYEPTAQLLAYMGIDSVQNLPDREAIEAKLQGIVEEVTADSLQVTE